MPSQASWSSSQPSTGSQQVVARRHRSANVPTRSSVHSCRVRGEHRPGLLDMPRLLLTLLSEAVWVMACMPLSDPLHLGWSRFPRLRRSPSPAPWSTAWRYRP
jgi:hypothetical protein